MIVIVIVIVEYLERRCGRMWVWVFGGVEYLYWSVLNDGWVGWIERIGWG